MARGAPLPSTGSSSVAAAAGSNTTTGAAAAAVSPLVGSGEDPLAYQDQLDFNTRRFPQYSHVIECAPSSGSPEKTVCLCRCWQSKKFPYCDDTHKVLVEAGDNVGPFVARLRGSLEGDTSRQRRSLQQSISNSNARQRSACVGSLDSPSHGIPAEHAPATRISPFLAFMSSTFRRPPSGVPSVALTALSGPRNETLPSVQMLLPKLPRAASAGQVTAATTTAAAATAASGPRMTQESCRSSAFAGPRPRATPLYAQVSNFFCAPSVFFSSLLSPRHRAAGVGVAAALLLLGGAATVGALSAFGSFQQRNRLMAVARQRGEGDGERAAGATAEATMQKGQLHSAAAHAAAVTPTASSRATMA